MTGFYLGFAFIEGGLKRLCEFDHTLGNRFPSDLAHQLFHGVFRFIFLVALRHVRLRSVHSRSYADEAAMDQTGLPPTVAQVQDRVRPLTVRHVLERK